MTTTRRTLRHSMWLVAALAGWAGVGAVAQDEARPGMDAPRVRVCVPDFISVGQGDVDVAQVSGALRLALAAQTQIELVDGPQVRQQASAARDGLIAMTKGAARALGDRIGVDAVVYGTVVQDVAQLLDEPVQLAEPLVQLTVVETLTLEGQLFPGVPLSARQATGPEGLMAEQTRALLPAMGRVLSIIESPEGTSVQLFPLGGRVLAADTEYGVFEPVRFSVLGDDPTGQGKMLALQDLRAVELAGRVRTTAQPSGHVIAASAVDPAGHVAVGQLVAVPPAGPAASVARRPILLLHSEPPGAVVFVDGQVVGVTPVATYLEPGRETKASVACRDRFATEYAVTPETGDAWAAFAPLREIPPFGSLRVTSTPEGAAVSLDGAALGVTPLAVDQVAAGPHELLVALDGFRPEKRDLEVRRQKATELTVDLEKDFRRVHIVSTPEGARTLLDGEDIGNTPALVETLQTGDHEVRLSLPAHAPISETIRVLGEQPEQTFRFRLRPLAGNINVQTTPAGARVTLDGVERGTTPLALTNLAIGEHRLAIALDGYLPLQRTVTVQDQQTATVQEDLTKAEGRLVCISVPAGAAVVLDGRELGVTPQTLAGVPVGRRTLRLTLEGYEPWEAGVPVVQGETTKVEVALIRTEQAGARGGP